MAGKLRSAILWGILGLLPIAAVAQDVPKLRTLAGRSAAIEPRIMDQTAVEQSAAAKTPTVAEPPVAVRKIEPKIAALPGVPVADRDVKKALDKKVAAILGEKILRGRSVGIQITDLDSGDVVYAHNADKMLTPASNTKLVTTAAALHILGADYQFGTQVLAHGEVVKGVLKGDLHLHIDHDFTWSARFYETADVPMRGLIAQIKAAGIRQITGRVIVSGYVVYGGVPTGTLVTTQHLQRAANAFAGLLRKNKISYHSLSVRQNAKPEGREIAHWKSPMLSEAIVPLNRVSHNEYADMLLLALGAKTSGKNSYEAGAKALREWLQKSGLLAKGFVQQDGSGLSHANRMSAAFFNDLVAYMLRSPYSREWAASMSISGYDGTYGGRLANEDGKGRVYAKSGTLRDTISGSGFFVNRHDGHTYAFSVIVNGLVNKKLTRPAIDRIVRVFLGAHLADALPAVPRMRSLRREDGTVTASWDAVDGVAGYRVYTSDDGARWQKAFDTDATSVPLEDRAVHVRVTAVDESGLESAPSLIFSYRPGKRVMTVVEEARCRSDEAMRPANHLMAHERPLADFVGADWGVETVRVAGEGRHDGLLFHSATCRGAIAWNDADYRRATAQGGIPVIVNVVDAHLSADAKGECNPAAGGVLGCFADPVITRDRRIGERAENTRLRKAAGTGSSRPSAVRPWQGSSVALEMGAASVATRQTKDDGSFAVIGFDLQALDSNKSLRAAWKNMNID